MKASPPALTRRSVLLTTGAATAYSAVLPLFLPVSPAAADPRQDSVEAVSFVGSNRIQLTVIDTKLTNPERENLRGSSRVQPRGGNNIRDQGYTQVDGRTGFISGDLHQTAPQLFRPLAEVIPGTDLIAFNGEQAQIDQPQSWVAMVDGAIAVVKQVYRKSLPIRSERAGRRSYNHCVRHVLTIELDLSIAEGAMVRLAHPGIDTFEIMRNAADLSEVVHVCQQGYPIVGPKKGYVGLWLGHAATGDAGNTDQNLSEATSWRLVDADTGVVALSGTLEIAKAGNEEHRDALNFNGCDIYVADFSRLDRDGRFRLEVDGIGSSVRFDVSEDPYRNCFRAAARWYFHQRSGIAIDEAYGEGRTRPRNGHPDDGLKIWQSDVALGQTREGFSSASANQEVRKTKRLGLLEETDQGYPIGSEHPHAWGGWHDAGDWDRRIQHMDAVFTMAHIVELFPTSRVIDLNIPESGKPFADAAVFAKKSHDDKGDGSTILPDLIHEALWGISLWRRTQTREGGIIGGVEYSSDGVVGSVSWNPHQLAFAYKPEIWSAYRFAIAASKLGHVISVTVGDKVLGQSLIDEAMQAWIWAEARMPQIVPESLAETPEDVNPDNASDVPSSLVLARIAAAATIYRATGDGDARAVFEAHNPFLPQSDFGSLGAKPGVYSAESLEYLRAGQEGRDVHPEIVASMQDWASRRLKGPTRMGADYGLHTTPSYPWGRGWARFGPGSNWRASELAHQYRGKSTELPLLRDIVVEGLWFGLGCNPSNVSFVQGFGSRQFGDPSGADYYGLPKVPGQIAFGVVMGEMHSWERDRIAGHLYPTQQVDWPIYAQIFESKAVNTSAEHGMKSNAMEWLFANSFAHELIARF